MTDQTALSKPEKPYARLKALISSDDVQGRFSALLGKRAPAYLASVLTIASDPKLIDCEPVSVLNVAAKAAVLDLPLDPNLGFAWLIPYKNKDKVKIAQFQLGYKGYIQLGLRSGQYKALNATEIYEGEDIRVDRLTGNVILNGKRTGDTVTGYVAYFCLLNGFEKFVYMSTDEIIAHAKKYSKSYGYQDSPWTTAFDWMAKKTVIRRLLSKYGILSIQMMGAFKEDMDNELPLDLGEKFEPAEIIDGQATDIPEGTTVPNFDDLKEPEQPSTPTEPEATPMTPADMAVAQGLVDHVKHAKNILAFRKPTCPLDELDFIKAYVGWKEKTGANQKQAAEYANAGEFPK